MGKVIPIKEFTVEIEIKKSRFIGFGYNISSPENARKILKELKAIYDDARHVCYGFVWGSGSTHMGMSDDGEPNGTAGRPILEVVKGSGYEDFLIAVVRYFGGTKLGTGGLVKAYTEISQIISKGIFVEEFIEKEEFDLSFSYNIYEGIKKIILDLGGEIESESFLSDVSVQFKLAIDKTSNFKESVRDISKGSILL